MTDQEDKSGSSTRSMEGEIFSTWESREEEPAKEEWWAPDTEDTTWTSGTEMTNQEDSNIISDAREVKEISTPSGFSEDTKTRESTCLLLTEDLKSTSGGETTVQADKDGSFQASTDLLTDTEVTAKVGSSEDCTIQGTEKDGYTRNTERIGSQSHGS